MRIFLIALVLIAASGATPALAQKAPGYGRGTLYEGLLADHSAGNGNNGATRLGPRLGGKGNASAQPPPSTQAASPQNVQTPSPGSPLVQRLFPGDALLDTGNSSEAPHP